MFKCIGANSCGKELSSDKFEIRADTKKEEILAKVVDIIM
jgi:hypothetical protein